MSCCVCCGLCCSFPKKVKIAACITAIPVLLFFSVYVAWIALGTYLVALMDGDLRNKKVCRNVTAYIAFLYLYLFCLSVFGLIVLIWKLHREIKGSEGGSSSSSAAERGAKTDPAKQMQNMQRSAKLMSAVV